MTNILIKCIDAYNQEMRDEWIIDQSIKSLPTTNFGLIWYIYDMHMNQKSVISQTYVSYYFSFILKILAVGRMYCNALPMSWRCNGRSTRCQDCYSPPGNDALLWWLYWTRKGWFRLHCPPTEAHMENLSSCSLCSLHPCDIRRMQIEAWSGPQKLCGLSQCAAETGVSESWMGAGKGCYTDMG